MSSLKYMLSILEYSLVIFALILMFAIIVLFVGNTNYSVLELRP